MCWLGLIVLVVDDGASTVYISELVGECFADARDVFVRLDVSATLESGVADGCGGSFFHSAFGFAQWRVITARGFEFYA